MTRTPTPDQNTPHSPTGHLLPMTEAQQESLEAYRDRLGHLGYRKHTQQYYHNCVRDFLAHAGESNMDRANIESYLRYLESRPLKRKRSKGTALSPASISHHVQAIKRYFDGLLLNGELDSHPMAGIHLPKAASMPREAMPVETVQQLYAHTQKPIETALLGVYYGCGLRRGEGVRLDVMDVHLPMQVLVVREGKFGKRREVPLSPKVASDFAAYIENGRWHARCGAFLVNAKGKRMDGGTANRMLGQMLLRAGIPERYSLHHLRTSLATHLQANGAGLSQVQEILGHRSFDTTIRYLNTTSCSH